MSFTTDDVAAEQIKDRLKSIQAILQEIEKRRSACEQTLNALQRISAEEKTQNGQKIKSLMKTAMTQTESEREIIEKALQKIHEIRNIKNERRIQARNSADNREYIRNGTWMKLLQNLAQTIPLFVGRPGEKAPPLCGSIPAVKNHIAKAGDMVAALVYAQQKKESMWIVAEVVSYNATTKKYEVDDILQEQNQKGRHVLNSKRIVHLARMRANPETNPEALYPEKTLVMALFPQTSCFYKALITKTPATHTDDYEAVFEDLSYASGYSPPLSVAQRYIFPCKKDSRNMPGTSQGAQYNDSEVEDLN